MPGRIITLQRQARELGRLRTGTYVPPANGKKGFPQRSRTWILTTHQREYLETAAEEWGGQIEEWEPQGGGAKEWRLITEADAINAIMPPGDPLSQANEMWSKGGCQRRCDGQTEQLSNKSCLCLAQYGEEFYLRRPEEVCRPHTRLNVILPDLPDLGVWRMESKGFYAANEIAAAVDMILHATGGRLAVPVRLRIEPRSRVAEGKTKRYPVIVVEIRGATAGQILAGAAPTIAIDAESGRAAIEAPKARAIESAPDTAGFAARIEAATSMEHLRLIWADLRDAGVNDPALRKAWEAKGASLKAAKPEPTSAEPATEPEPVPQPPVEEVVDAELVADVDALWGQIMTAAGKAGITKLDKVVAAYEELMGHHPDDEKLATPNAMAEFLAKVKAGEVR